MADSTPREHPVPKPPSVGGGHATRVLTRFGTWQVKKGIGRTSPRVTLEREGKAFVLYDHGEVTGVLKLSSTGPKVLSFRPWRARFQDVLAHLLKKDWKVKAVNGGADGN